MGCGTKYECEKCGYKFGSLNGVGFMYPSVYKETVEKGKAGKLGDELRKFFEEHPDGAINAENVTLCCDKCGHLDTAQNLTMYVPKENVDKRKEIGRWSVAFSGEGTEYVGRNELYDYYQEYAKYPHKCGECSGAMHIVSDSEELKCPKCKIPLKTVDLIMWD